jgi:hypothetical protein
MELKLNRTAVVATRRGYLNNSTQRVFSATGAELGKVISLGSIISAQASDRRASS